MRLRFTATAAIPIILCGCIHDHPGPDAHDPTLVNVAIEVTPPPEWEEKSLNVKTREDSHESQHRIIAEVMRNGKKEWRHEQIISGEEYSSGPIIIRLPFSLHAVEYTLSVWSDILHPESAPAYDAELLNHVTPSEPIPFWESRNDCSFFSNYIDLRKYRNQWDSKVVVPTALSRPIARFEIVATDLQEFLDYTEFERQHGETYTVTLSGHSRIESVFDATSSSGATSFFISMPDKTIPLSLYGHPPDEILLHSCALFPEEEASIDATITVYNSARLIMAKSEEFTIPLERGKVTRVKGNFLTNFYKNSINVDNIWNGEILIEI